jgi:hypothetical protein
MRKIIYILLSLIVASSVLTSCSNFLDVDSDRYVFDDEYQMKSSNDSLYSMFGVFSLMQELADSYVLLGELRGDLMDITDKSDRNLVEINNFEISKGNKYGDKIRTYYAIINNCNYIINNVDTTIINGGEKVMYKVYAASKAIRAWTYMQLVLNYKKAVYFEKPLLNLDDAQKEYPEYDMAQLAPVLIKDLEPWKNIAEPEFGQVNSLFINECFFPIRFLLGDLYLWTEQYDKAATEYHDLMFREKYSITNDFKSTRSVLNNAFTGLIDIYWLNIFGVGSSECISVLSASNEFGTNFNLDSLVFNYKVKASDVSVNNWDSQMYYYSTTLDTLGDLRKWGSTWSYNDLSTYIYRSYEAKPGKDNYIIKYMRLNPSTVENRQVMVYRTALLYLRYAEAVNRLGKPHLAMAVLKNGLTRINMNNPKIIPVKEKSDPLPGYMNFTDVIFDNNKGIRPRGCGNLEYDTLHYIIPANVDTMTYVEDLIVNELALETAFEGNRFHDLMRIAVRRNDNSYLANRVAAKHKTNSEAIKNKLLNRDNWYIKQ